MGNNGGIFFNVLTIKIRLYCSLPEFVLVNCGRVKSCVCVCPIPVIVG